MSRGIFDSGSRSNTEVRDRALGRPNSLEEYLRRKSVQPKPNTARIVSVSKWAAASPDVAKALFQPEQKSFQWMNGGKVIFDYSDIADEEYKSSSNPIMLFDIPDVPSTPMVKDRVDLQLEEHLGTLMHLVFDLQRTKNTAAYFEERQNAALELVMLKNNLSLLIGEAHGR